MSENKAIENFLQDIHCLDPIIEKVNKINIFKILGIEQTEIRHSNMLAWLMDPKGNHGLGDEILRKMIRTCRTDFDIDHRSFIIKREWNNIDILAISEQEKALLCIENKTDTGEHDNQLARYKELVNTTYPDYKKAFIYLTPAGKISSDPESWINVGYKDVLNIIETAIQGKRLATEAELLIRNYIETIKENILKEDDTRKLCEEIHRKHRKALEMIHRNETSPEYQEQIDDICRKYQPIWEIVWENRPGKQAAPVTEAIHQWAEQQTETGRITLDPNNTTEALTRFKTVFMSGLLSDTEGTQSAWHTGNIYFYEIRNIIKGNEHELFIQLAIGSKGITQAQREICDQINEYFPANQKKDNWAYRVNYSTRHIFFDSETDEKVITDQLNSFLSEIYEFEEHLARVITE